MVTELTGRTSSRGQLLFQLWQLLVSKSRKEFRGIDHEDLADGIVEGVLRSPKGIDLVIKNADRLQARRLPPMLVKQFWSRGLRCEKRQRKFVSLDEVAIPDRRAAPRYAGGQERREGDCDLGFLAEQDRQLLQLMADGLTQAAIAQRLRISVRTVRNRLRSIRERAADRRRTLVRQ